jgi:hypothetical protein
VAPAHCPIVAMHVAEAESSAQAVVERARMAAHDERDARDTRPLADVEDGLFYRHNWCDQREHLYGPGCGVMTACLEGVECVNDIAVRLGIDSETLQRINPRAPSRAINIGLLKMCNELFRPADPT